MKKMKFLIVVMFISFDVYAYRQVDEIAIVVDGYDIPIRICIPNNAKGKIPVMFYVHGGGWNGGTEKAVPPAVLPADCDYLCDELGIIYVGLAYRCKINNGTFHKALQDLESSIKWFDERANDFNADMTRIGFCGGSAGTTLSAVLSHRYSNCKVYIGYEGMYNVSDMDSLLSHFPDAKAKRDYGLISHEQQLEASPYHQVGRNPMISLLLHGREDWLCHYSQSIKYAEKLREAGGDCNLVLYDDINHHCLHPGYPDVFKNSMMEIARTLQKGYRLNNVDFLAIQANLDEKMKLQYPYQSISTSKILGKWKSLQDHIFLFEDKGIGRYLHPGIQNPVKLSYQVQGSHFSVKVEGETENRTFYLRKNDHTIFELITAEDCFKSFRIDYQKVENKLKKILE